MKGLVILALVAFAAAELPFHPMNAPFMPGSNGRIINGDEATSGDWPWQASMQRFGSHFCGASVVSANYLVCAAHCAVYDTGVTANVGSVEWKNPGQSIGATFIPHPNYNADTLDFDYSVVALDSPATLNENVKPIELATQEYPGGTSAITTGWGYVIRFPATIPDLLQVATIPLQDASVCAEYWGSQINFTDRMQCAAGNGGSSSCMGDSGGPLVVADASKDVGYVLVGAVSWGSSTCSTSAPSAYAKISDQVAWINQQTGL